MIITEPGIYDMPSDVYHADPTPGSLSSGGAHTLAFECPAAFYYARQHPVNKRVFDVGTATHLLILEPEKFDNTIVIIDGRTKDGKPSKGYQSQEARDQRDAAYAVGKTPLLPEEVETIRAMRDALWRDPLASKAFRNGKAEQSVFWKDTEFGVWCRTRPDWIPTHQRYLINLKTAASAAPDDVAKAIFNLGYFQKAAWEMDGMEAVTGIRPEKYCLLVQSKQAPYLPIPVWLHPDDLAWGQKANRYARGVFAWCSERDDWPGYSHPVGADAPRGFEDIRMPAWAMKALEQRDLAGGFVPPQTLKAAAE